MIDSPTRTGLHPIGRGRGAGRDGFGPEKRSGRCSASSANTAYLSTKSTSPPWIRPGSLERLEDGSAIQAAPCPSIRRKPDCLWRRTVERTVYLRKKRRNAYVHSAGGLGDYALFTRPEMKVERVSYDIADPLRRPGAGGGHLLASWAEVDHRPHPCVRSHPLHQPAAATRSSPLSSARSARTV